MRKVRIAGLSLVVLFVGGLASLVRPDLSVTTIHERYVRDGSRFAEVDGLRVHYRDEGQGPVLLLLHGTGASLYTWDAWVARLKNDFRIVRLDLPGYAVTGPTADPDFDYGSLAYAEFLDGFARALNLQRFAIAGNSLGGRVAWTYAVLHPQKIDKLILIDAAGYKQNKRPAIFRLAAVPGVGEALVYITPRFLIRNNLMQVYGDDALVTEDRVTLYQDFIRREGNRAAMLKRIRNPGRNAPAERIAKIAAPTLILWGAEDRWIDVEHGRKFERDIPGSRLIVYPGAGHVPMEEIPAATARDARRFLLNRQQAAEKLVFRRQALQAAFNR